MKPFELAHLFPQSMLEDLASLAEDTGTDTGTDTTVPASGDPIWGDVDAR